MVLRIPTLRDPSRFPAPPKDSDILAVSDVLALDLVIDAYAHGIFPWPDPSESVIPWCFPRRRGILRFDHFHLSSSTQKKLRATPFRVSFNQAFEGVVIGCSRKNSPTHDAHTRWMTDEMIGIYSDLHRYQCAHSVEVWSNETQELVGGVLGVDMNGVFSAESMFSLESNASKFGLLKLIERLERRRSWMDIQVLNEHTASLGGTEVSRDQYLQLLDGVQQDRWRHLF